MYLICQNHWNYVMNHIMEKHVAAYAIESLIKLRKTNPKRLARVAGVGETYIRDLLKGRSRDPQTNKLTKVAEALSTTLDDLISLGNSLRSGRVGEDRKSTPNLFNSDFSNNTFYSEQEIALIDLWRELSLSQRAALLCFIEASINRDAA